MVKVGFYAPMKSPHHAVASGDREVARNFMLALEGAGFAVDLVSELRVHLGDVGDSCLVDLEREADLEFIRLRDLWESDVSLCPDLLFCYHVYYKSPDLLLCRLADYFGLPYVIAEASYSGKRSVGDSVRGHELSCWNIGSADLILQLNSGDMGGLVELLGSGARVVEMDVFGNFSDWGGRGVVDRCDILPDGWVGDCVFVVHAMMRGGDKFSSYEVLAGSLSVLDGLDGWRLVIIGGGVEEVRVRNLFSGYGDRVLFLGLLGRGEIYDWLSCCDVYVWPCVGEAYGMGLLEGLWFGLPMVVGDRLGVRGIVDGGGGVLCREGDVVEFGVGVRMMYDDYWGGKELISKFRDYNLEKSKRHNLDSAIVVLKEELGKIIKT